MHRGVGRCVPSEPSQPLDGTHSTSTDCLVLREAPDIPWRGVATIADEYSRVVACKLPKQKTNNKSSRKTLSGETYRSSSSSLPVYPPYLPVLLLAIPAARHFCQAAA
jgi:hypothetical protein